MTGDVFEGISIPGLPGESEGLGIVLTHPCSMRADGVRLIPRLHVASVATNQQIPLRKWSDGHFKVMPLPELNGRHCVASFEQMGVVNSESLVRDRRIACLSPYGIHLMQQRFIWYLTRFLVPTHRLAETTVSVFEEADLQEEWVNQETQRGINQAASTAAFHAWIRSPDETTMSPQDQLADPQRRAGVRRAMQRHLARGQ